jgi:2-keto-4-pentenoate hydratase/2-oxohepta-3-ene-1,7-dioic acid hydratase in catechol pathway
MRIARADTPDGIVRGEYDGETVSTDERTYTIGETATLLPPCEPGTIYCMERNYRAYIEQNIDADGPPDEIMFFLKGHNCLRASGEEVPLPSFSSEVGYAGELTAVIGEECSDVAPGEVASVVEGYTILNDMDAKDQEGIGAMKVFEGAAPLGPCVATDVDPTDLDMHTTVGGEERQNAHTSRMLRGPEEVVSALSERITLSPGDVIALGSPANPGTVAPGEEMAITYEGIGTLRNTLAAE